MDGIPDIGAIDSIVTALGALVALASSGFTETAVLHRRREIFATIAANESLHVQARSAAARKARDADLRIVAIGHVGGGFASLVGIVCMATGSIFTFLLPFGRVGDSVWTTGLFGACLGIAAFLASTRSMAIDRHIAVLSGASVDPSYAKNVNRALGQVFLIWGLSGVAGLILSGQLNALGEIERAVLSTSFVVAVLTFACASALTMLRRAKVMPAEPDTAYPRR